MKRQRFAVFITAFLIHYLSGPALAVGVNVVVKTGKELAQAAADTKALAGAKVDSDFFRMTRFVFISAVTSQADRGVLSKTRAWQLSSPQAAVREKSPSAPYLWYKPQNHFFAQHPLPSQCLADVL